MKKYTHSPGLSGEGCHHSSKASRREDLQVEEPVACGDGAAFHLHTTRASVLGATLVRNQIVQVREPCQKGLWAPGWMVKAFHREQFPLDGVMGLV
jgi:hypothetical protein